MIHLAFVLLKGSLLKKAKLPDATSLATAFSKRMPGLGFHIEPGDKSGTLDGIHSIGFDGGRVFVAFVPAAIPKGEADEGFEFSIASWSSSFRRPQHNAHLVVTMQLEADLSLLEAQRRFTGLIAGVMEASKAVAVYWGQAGASHPADFFLDVANGDPDMWVMVWTGVSRARPSPDRVSLLSLGMDQFGIKNLMVNAPGSMGQDLVMNFFQLLDYAIQRGDAIPEGDTVGESETQRLRVKYEPSPIDPSQTIWRIDY